MDRNYKIRIILSAIIAGIFIYHRKLDYYETMPRKSILVSFLIILWSISVYYETIVFTIGIIFIEYFWKKT